MSEKTRPQDATPKRVLRSTYLLSMALNTCVTAAIVTVGMWFVWNGVHSAAREAVVSDMSVVSKSQK